MKIFKWEQINHPRQEFLLDIGSVQMCVATDNVEWFWCAAVNCNKNDIDKPVSISEVKKTTSKELAQKEAEKWLLDQIKIFKKVEAQLLKKKMRTTNVKK